MYFKFEIEVINYLITMEIKHLGKIENLQF